MNGEETNRLTRRVESLRGVACTSIGFCGMANCNERYAPAVSPGYHELTWGVILQFARDEPLALTWNEDSRLGDPFFLDYTEAREFMAIDSLELQDVSAFPPWKGYVGSRLLDFDVLRYETNYPSDGEGPWRFMPWGLELIFEAGPLLIGAMHHGDFLTYTICADEVVVVHDPELIEKVKGSRSGQRSEWTKPTV